jgi:hypothetical protein
MSRSLVVLLLLSTVVTFSAAALPAQEGTLTIELPSFEYLGDSDIAHGFATLRNTGQKDVYDSVVSVRMNGAPTIYLGGDGCVNGDTPHTLSCSVPFIAAGASRTIQLYLGPIREARVFLAATAVWNGPVNAEAKRTVSFPRDYVVTNTGDEGPGSLRAAIDAVNADCDLGIPCRIAFHIGAPVPPNGWFTIYPNTPLPEITAADIEIDGATQTQFGGDTNPLGPEIELNGAATGVGHGLVLGGRGFASISNLAIGGFPWDGIAVQRNAFSESTITNNYIGTDASGTRALPNLSRGITFNRPAIDFDVTHNLIAHNVRAGVFVAGGFNLLFAENTIRANSAGIFLGPDSHDIRVERNSIRENTQFGVAVGPATASYELVDNSITRNGFMGIDRGLNGPGYEPDERDPVIAHVAPPRVLSARYDPIANITTITGTYFDDRMYFAWEVALFQSSVNDGQGEEPIGRATVTNGAFSLTVPGDRRGKFITATGQLTLTIEIGGPYHWTSEFSEAIEVQ